eukprot:gnl/MRDRNA2_/MRDRNA2_191372_c0_seq1.p1 gnl/MRDRNA2_/MRDRNA2_191372_c0~~gnl/MRDRNA2_/MRDRNA2_191372_c0_seq1.p1  ORF type:complete len:103 (-),score=1.76 gnl/MRDRNA2_/MRDRNA2_191372_c0_seq1:71-379(-)
MHELRNPKCERFASSITSIWQSTMHESHWSAFYTFAVPRLYVAFIVIAAAASAFFEQWQNQQGQLSSLAWYRQAFCGIFAWPLPTHCWLHVAPMLGCEASMT